MASPPPSAQAHYPRAFQAPVKKAKAAVASSSSSVPEFHPKLNLEAHLAAAAKVDAKPEVINLVSDDEDEPLFPTLEELFTEMGGYLSNRELTVAKLIFPSPFNVFKSKNYERWLEANEERYHCVIPLDAECLAAIVITHPCLELDEFVGFPTQRFVDMESESDDDSVLGVRKSF